MKIPVDLSMLKRISLGGALDDAIEASGLSEEIISERKENFWRFVSMGGSLQSGLDDVLEGAPERGLGEMIFWMSLLGFLPEE